MKVKLNKQECEYLIDHLEEIKSDIQFDYDLMLPVHGEQNEAVKEAKSNISFFERIINKLEKIYDEPTTKKSNE